MSDDYIRKVEALLNRANHPETNEQEREACLERADLIMKKHRLDRAMLFQGGKTPEREIIVKKYDRIQADKYDTTLSYMRNSIFRHCGAMFRPGWRHGTAVGYEEDLFFAEMLWSSVYLDFTTKMFPRWETYRNFDLNVYLLKTAGYSWPDVRDMALKHSPSDQTGPLTFKNAGSKLRTAFKRECERRGEEVQRQPQNPEKWRNSFAHGYDVALRTRLWELERKNSEKPGSPGEIALLKDSDRVKAKYWELFPEEHPDAVKRAEDEWNARVEAEEAAMTPAQKAARDRKQEAASKRAMKRMDARFDYAGYQSGRRSAEDVSLSRNTTVGEPNRKELS